MLAGAIDVVSLPNGAAGRKVSVLRNLMNMGVLAMFAVAFMMRMRTPDRVASGGLFVLEVLALVAGYFALWYGGELAGRRRERPVFARAQAGNRL